LKNEERRQARVYSKALVEENNPVEGRIEFRGVE
jgi:hypothetical protein